MPKILGPVLFILLFIAALIALGVLLPYDNNPDNPINRFLPTGGFLLGEEPEAWIGDSGTEQRIAGKGRENRPRTVDVDFIKVNKKWYKIRGPLYITGGGKMIGWHREVTPKEALFLGRWLSQ